MIVDTSAMVAVLFDEPDGHECLEHIFAADDVCMSAAASLELAIIIDSRGTPVLSRQLDRLRSELGIYEVPVTATQVSTARAAYRDFGRGSGHPAQLNFGDCFSYALAIDRNEPLLWIGEDFGHTDVQRAR